MADAGGFVRCIVVVFISGLLCAAEPIGPAPAPSVFTARPGDVLIRVDRDGILENRSDNGLFTSDGFWEERLVGIEPDGTLLFLSKSTLPPPLCVHCGGSKVYDPKSELDPTTRYIIFGNYLVEILKREPNMVTYSIGPLRPR
jgi:hypothetical protein